MQALSPSRRRQFIIISLLIVYLAGYLAARGTHVLVHRVSFATEPKARVYFHRVVAGDFGPGLSQSAFNRFIISASYIGFTPLRWAEALVWRLIPRDYVFTNDVA